MEKKNRQMETSKAMESKIHVTYHLPTLNMEKYYFAAKSFELHTCMICWFVVSCYLLGLSAQFIFQMSFLMLIKVVNTNVVCLVKSVNLPCNLLIRWADGTNSSLTKRLMFKVLWFFQRYIYQVLQTIQMKLILLCVWAEPAVLGSAKTALKFIYKI